MTKTLKDIKIDELIPASLKADADASAIAQAITPEFQDISNLIDLLDPTQDILSFLSEDNQNKYLDLLAWENHVDFYDIDLPLDQKKALIDKSGYFHKRKGTPAAVEDLINTIFGDGQVVEWFEYDAQPGYFKVVTTNMAITQDLADQFTRALDSVKRKSAWLDKVEVATTDSMNLYFGGVAHIGDNLTLKQVM